MFLEYEKFHEKCIRKELFDKYELFNNMIKGNYDRSKKRRWWRYHYCVEEEDFDHNLDAFMESELIGQNLKNTNVDENSKKIGKKQKGKDGMTSSYSKQIKNYNKGKKFPSTSMVLITNQLKELQ